jgi:hypothetical protein
MTKRSTFVAAALALVVAFAGPQAFAQQPAGKSGIERMYVLYCRDIALDNHRWRGAAARDAARHGWKLDGTEAAGGLRFSTPTITRSAMCA